jgi:hypothetical protein
VQKESAAKQDSAMQMPDSAHMRMSDSAHAQMRDTSHKPMSDSAHAQMRDTSHAHMPDSAHAQMRDTAHAHMPDSAHAQMPDSAHAQMHDTSHMQMRDTTHAMPADSMQMGMDMNGPLGISMERMGSGTTWTPDALKLPSRHFMLGGWGVMLHGFAFAQYDKQGGPRGHAQFGSLNWAMIMADRSLGGGRFTLRFMPSLDPATVGKCGYPLLLQSGETCNGQPLVDRQHPHDLFMELAAQYEREITPNVAVLLYAAPAGEPALGPVAFMHRPTAMDNPFAPLGHHWQDATHISFGVLTAGIYTRALRLEASAFNGIEPDESRWNFDPIEINSYSARLTLNPDTSWSFTAGYGSIIHPEAGNPNGLLHRLVLSAMYGKRLGADGQWGTTLVYGANREDGWSSSALIESEAILDRHNTIFGRAELVQKSSEDLVLPALPDQRFNVGAASLGYIREIIRGRSVTVGFGAAGTVNLVPSALETPYGSRTPIGGMVFLRLRPYAPSSGESSTMGGTPAHHDE